MAGHISEDFKSSHPEVPWKNIRGMRNVVAHAYGSLSIQTTWETIIADIPEPSPIEAMLSNPGDTKTLVDVDFTIYRKKNDNRSVRKNVTIPNRLNSEAETAGVNFSAVLQDALKKELGLH